MKKSNIIVVTNSLLIYDYVGGQEDVNPDPYEVRTSSILCSLVLWLQVGYLWIYITLGSATDFHEFSERYHRGPKEIF